MPETFHDRWPQWIGLRDIEGHPVLPNKEGKLVRHVPVEGGWDKDGSPFDPMTGDPRKEQEDIYREIV